MTTPQSLREQVARAIYEADPCEPTVGLEWQAWLSEADAAIAVALDAAVKVCADAIAEMSEAERAHRSVVFSHRKDGASFCAQRIAALKETT